MADGGDRSAELRAAVRAKYRAFAEDPGRGASAFAYPIGPGQAASLGYDPGWLAGLPADAVAGFAGVGDPFRVRRPARGERVLDVGCGTGTDVLVAARLAGPSGRAVGVDATPEMAARARRAAAGWREGNASFAAAAAEALPFPDRSFDLVISNGALNLVPDKDAAFREIARVLRPGGFLAAADLLVVEGIPPEVLASLDAWST